MEKFEHWKKNITLFLTGQIISLFGSSLVQYAILWHITLETQSGVMMTIYIICGFLPTFFLSPFAGVWADRYNRKKIIILADAFIALATLVLAILYIMGYEYIWLLFVIAAVRAFGSGLHGPAISAVIPQLVPENQLTRVNGINTSVQSIIMLISPIVSAALLGWFELQYIFFIDVVTAIFAIMVLMFLVEVPTHQKALEIQTTAYLDDLKAGFVYIRDHSYLKYFFVFSIFFFFMISPLAFLTPLQTVRSYGDDLWRLSALEISFSSGMIIGGIIMASWGGFNNKIHSMTLSTWLVGIGTVALGLKPPFWIYLALMAFMGITIPIFNTPAAVILQTKVEPSYMGRVFGVLGMIHSSMMPLGMLVFGPLSDSVSIELLLLVTGVFLFVMGFFLIGNKAMVKAGE
jgi:DHA3 family macrolide efflux protein-like MFS transporter